MNSDDKRNETKAETKRRRMTVDITSTLLRDMRPDIENALKAVAERYGVTMKLGMGHYGGLSGDYKLELTTTGKGGETAASRDFKRYAEAYGMSPEWFGQTFQSNGETYMIDAIHPRKRKQPIGITKVSNGAQMVSTAFSVRQQMQLAGYDVPYYYEDALVERTGTTMTTEPTE